MTLHDRISVTAPIGPTLYALAYGDTEYVATVNVVADELLSDRLTAQIAALVLLRDTVRFYEGKRRA